MAKDVEICHVKKNKWALNTAFTPFNDCVALFDVDNNHLHTWKLSP